MAVRDIQGGVGLFPYTFTFPFSAGTITKDVTAAAGRTVSTATGRTVNTAVGRTVNTATSRTIQDI